MSFHPLRQITKMELKIKGFDFFSFSFLYKVIISWTLVWNIIYNSEQQKKYFIHLDGKIYNLFFFHIFFLPQYYLLFKVFKRPAYLSKPVLILSLTKRLVKSLAQVDYILICNYYPMHALEINSQWLFE